MLLRESLKVEFRFNFRGYSDCILSSGYKKNQIVKFNYYILLFSLIDRCFKYILIDVVFFIIIGISVVYKYLKNSGKSDKI